MFKESDINLLINNKKLSLKEITIELCKMYHVIYDSLYLIEVSKCIKKNKVLRKNYLNIYEVKEQKYLYVSDDKYFRLIVDVLNEVFGLNYKGFQKGGMKVSDGNFVWFPQNEDEKTGWSNRYDKENKKWYETPKSDDAKDRCIKEVTGSIRYIFSHNEKGYKFTGVFKHVAVEPDFTSVYEMVDDKMLFFKTTSLYFEPVNLNQWNMFEIVKEKGHIEYFLATKDMKIGDFLLVYVGQQNKNYDNGIYAVAKIIENPIILENHPKDYCNGKLSVKTEIIAYDKKALISGDVFSNYNSQYRTVHVIEQKHYSTLKRILNIN